MTPLYRVLRGGLRAAVELFYVDVESTGVRHLPEDGPSILVANHPNSIMDTIVLGTRIDRQIHYLAKEELFENPVVSWIFDQCGVIPLRQSPTGDTDNAEAFRSAYELLGEGGLLGIFPEGRNSEERALHEIKTGAARIALGAEQAEEYDLGVRIVPVGLNYESRDRFMTRVVVRVGEPLEARAFAETHRRDERSAVRELTDRIEASLRRVVSTMRDSRTRRLAEQIERISGRELVDEVAGALDGGEQVRPRGFRQALLEGIKQADEGDAADFDRRLVAQERIGEALEYYERVAPKVVDALRLRVDEYVDHLEQLRIRGELQGLRPDRISGRVESLKLTLYALVFAVPAIWGFVNNAIPYYATRMVASRAPDEARRAFVGLIAAAVLFSSCYALQTWGLVAASGIHWVGAVAYVCSLPVTGFYFFRYRRRLSKYRDRILVRTMFRSDRNLVDALLAERDELTEAFDRLGNHYRQVLEARESGAPPPDLPDLELDPPFWAPPQRRDVRGN